MTRLFSLIYSLASTVLVGVALVATLVSGFVTGPAIIAAIVIGFVVAVPVAYVIAKRLHSL